MRKEARQAAIREIITAMPISSQDALRRQLSKRGFRVTQATLSRDMRGLGISRIPLDDGTRYVLRPSAQEKIPSPVVGAEVQEIDWNEAMIVVRTIPGAASTVGEFVDSLRDPDIIGTVAGDNTLLIIPRSQRRTRAVVECMKRTLLEGE